LPVMCFTNRTAESLEYHTISRYMYTISRCHFYFYFISFYFIIYCYYLIFLLFYFIVFISIFYFYFLFFPRPIPAILTPTPVSPNPNNMQVGVILFMVHLRPPQAIFAKANFPPRWGEGQVGMPDGIRTHLSTEKKRSPRCVPSCGSTFGMSARPHCDTRGERFLIS